jgi:hypothetical protein
MESLHERALKERRCSNKNCDRSVREGYLYCCGECWGSAQIALGIRHDKNCDQRHASDKKQ